MRQRDDFMPGQNRLQRAPKLPARPDDQYFHSAPPQSGGGSGEWGVGVGSHPHSLFPTPHSRSISLQTTARRPSTAAAVSPPYLSSTGSASESLRAAN